MRTVMSFLVFVLPSLVSGFVTPKTFTYVGDIAPLGYFDPLGITTNRDESTVKYLREAELQHGRVAMLSFITLAGLDIAFPDELAINKLASLSATEQSPYWIGVAFFELARMFNGWTNPTKSIFTLDEDYQPGNVFRISEDAYDEDSLNKELSNGRLAMLGCTIYMVQEVMTASSS